MQGWGGEDLGEGVRGAELGVRVSGGVGVVDARDFGEVFRRRSVPVIGGYVSAIRNAVVWASGLRIVLFHVLPPRVAEHLSRSCNPIISIS